MSAKVEETRMNTTDPIKALERLRREYGRLHDFVSDAIESGRLKEADIPDDYQAIVEQLVRCTEADDEAEVVLIEPGR